jgi:ABC-type uncharacterized transport system involved in gliding motility auxiliary subunit
MMAFTSNSDSFRDYQTGNKALPLSIRLQGRFKSAFPEGKPKTTDAEGKETAADTNNVSSLKDSEKEGVVVLVGDVDMLYDRISVERLSFFGNTFYQRSNNNLDFVLNMVEQLGGSSALIGLRSRGKFERPFERVLALEQEAQKRWQAEEAKLQMKLQETQTRLNELQTTKDPNQKFIISAEQKREIEKFRQEQFQTRKQLKEVRKNLRRDIESLGLKIKIINIAAVPIAVAGFGLTRGLLRKYRSVA